MSSIDKRVVEMEFDNKQFEDGVKDTLDSLEALKQGLKLEGASKGLQDINAAGQNVDLGGIASGVDHIADRFSALGAIGFTIIQNLTTAAMDYARKISGLVLDPLVAGGKRRAENIEQAKFQFRGLGVDVEAAMDDALYAVLGTAYGLDAAAKAASQLSASQVELGDDMKTALRGISGVAAMTNSSYEDTAHVFTRVAGQGRVMAVDLNSLASRGLNAAATLADAFGTTEAEVREMVTAGEVSFADFASAMDQAFGENATKANETYSGSLSNLRAALSRIGAGFFTTFLEQQRDLFNALTPAIDAVGEALEPVIDMLIGIMGARNFWLIDVLEGFDFSRLSLIFEPLLQIANNLFGALTRILTPLQRAFTSIFPPTSIDQIARILDSIVYFTETLKISREAGELLQRTFAGVFAIFSIGWSIVKELAFFLSGLFGMVFNGSGAILEFTANIGDFFVALDQAIKNGQGLQNFFHGLSMVLRGPINFVKGLAAALLELFSFEPPDPMALTQAFEPLGRLGEILLNLWSRIVNSWGRIIDLFKPIGNFLRDHFGGVGDAIVEVFDDLDFDKIMDILNTGLLGGVFLMFQRFADNVSDSFGSIQYRLTEPFRKLTFVMNTMQNTLRAMTLMQIAIAIGVLAASVVALSHVDAAGLTKALSAISVMMAQLVVSLKALTLVGGVKGLFTIGAGLILFAVALRILTSSVKALAELGWEDLAKGLTGVTVLIGGLVLAVKGMSGHTGGMFRAGAGLLVLAAAIKVLASAVTDLSDLSWEEMARGLVGVGTLLASLAIFTRLAAVNKGGLAQGAGLLLLAAGIKILASAVEDFAALSWGEAAKGLTVVASVLAAFAVFSRTVGNPAKMMAAGASLVLVGTAMNLLARAMGQFAGMSWEEIAKGLVSMGGALLAIVLALNLMPPNTLASATALIGVSVALGLIANALEDMGDMTWEEIAKGLITLAGSLTIIAAAMIAMTGALPGAAATLVVAAALKMLSPVLQEFGQMSFGEIAKGLGVLAAAFVILGLAGLLLTPVVPSLIGLGIAVALLGVGLMAAGAGIALFAAGLTALAAAGAAGTAAMVGFLGGIIGLIPVLAEQLGNAIIILIKMVAEAVPEMFKAMTAIMTALIQAARKKAPALIDLIFDTALKLVRKMRDTIPEMSSAALDMMLGILKQLNKKAPVIVGAVTTFLVRMMRAMEDHVPRFARAATNLLVAFINAISDNLDRVIRAGSRLVIKFIRGISDNMVKIVDAGMKAVIKFINGVADSIRDNTPALQRAGRNLASAIVSGLSGGLSDSVGSIVSSARSLAGSAITAARGVLQSRSPSKVFEQIGLDTGAGMRNGLKKAAPIVGKATQSLGEDTIETMKKSIAGMSDLLSMDPDMNPTITPILDLSAFRRDASQIGSELSGQQISFDRAYAKARYASFGYQANEAALKNARTVEEGKAPAVVTYNQYNQSPKALSAAEIYRQTKNQLSTTKGALTSDVTQEA